LGAGSKLECGALADASANKSVSMSRYRTLGEMEVRFA
jgi:hypothetical protein